ncbi:phage portal protein [Bosea sp. PAMC 26642]|uniref:phage portal protein n=1 Tax=Bosea sp. (strain PAMC 26642) TaxID=1792307 RepID=UPI00077039A4|nr:phage portal protein [Bosea sp. PAMC 26642]AMJ59225.1 portal protein [Bosea sp. PAMC 26642]
MLDFLRSLRGLAAPDRKRSRVGPLIALHEAGRPVWTPRDYAALAREGYERNPVVHRCVRLIAEAAAQTPLVAKVAGREEPGHPALMLIDSPNPRQGGIAFREMLYGHLLVAGNAYVEVASLGREPRELHALRPDRMRVVPGRDGWAEAYDYSVDGQTVRLRQDDGPLPPILHLTLFHPVDDHYGLSPIEAAACSLDIHNAASNWHKALLDNAARPSGALVYDSPDGASLTQAQFDRLKGELEESFQGARNAGRPLLLEGGLDWKPLSLTPAELDFVAAKGVAAREIALAFGVPPLLLGLPGDNTHANFAEANRAFWRQTAIPLVRRTAQSLAQWLGPAFGDDLTLEPDLDAVEALADERESLWRRVGAADFLSADEKREAVGYGRAAPATGDERS